MSLTEIIEELPKLTEQERELLFLKLEDLLHFETPPESEVEERAAMKSLIEEGLWSEAHEPPRSQAEVQATLHAWLTR